VSRAGASQDIRRLHAEALIGPRNSNPEAYLENEDANYGEAFCAFRKRLILDRLRRDLFERRRSEARSVTRAAYRLDS
jgi:hypothetical protein